MKYWILSMLATIVLFACQPEEKDSSWTIRGEAQGTTYQVTGWEDSKVEKEEIDSLLKALDQSLSTWVKGSVIDQFNRDSSGAKIDGHFASNLFAAYDVHEQTSGAFNPLIKPLLGYWGFGPDARKPESVDSLKVDSLLALMDWEQLQLVVNGDTVSMNNGGLSASSKARSYPIDLLKMNPGVQLDFNALAQGYSVDVIAHYLISQGVKHFLVELGGEMIVQGTKQPGQSWVVGIDKPIEGNQPGNRKLMATLKLKDRAIATSGNYRKFVEIDGVKYHHTFDPKTGFPARHQLLSATVIAKNCQMADAYATAFMVMGFPKAQAFLQEGNADLQVMLVYNDSEGVMKTYLSPGLESQIDYIEE